MTVIRNLIQIFMITTLFACSSPSVQNNITTDCFIIGGCENTAYDTSRVYLRASYTINGKFINYSEFIYDESISSDNIEIKSPELYSICGSIKYSDTPVYSNLRFIKQNNTSILIPSSSVETDIDGKYCILLESGKYTILVSPYKKETIPQLKTDIEVDSDITDLDIIYPPQNMVRYIYGNIILDLKSGLPVQGINVLAYKNYDDRISLQSNIATTDENGNFSLIIPTIEGDFSLLISGSADNPDWPKIWFEDIITEGTVQIGTINLDFVPPLKHTEGLILSGESTRIVARTTSENSIYSKSFNTDSTGHFETDIRTGKYDLLLMPEDLFTSRWGITLYQGVSLPSEGNLQFRMDSKVVISGKINVASDEDTPRVNIMRTGGCYGEMDNVQNENTLITSIDGLFKDTISKGMYRIIINTDNNKSAPLISDYICIDKDTDLGVLTLPANKTISGRIVPPSGFSINNGMVEAFVLNRARNEYVKIGSSVVSNNKFSLTIPVLR